MKKLIVLLFVIFSATASYSQIMSIEKSPAEHAETEYNTLMAVLHRVNPDLTMNVNQRLNLMKVMERRSKEIIDRTYDHMHKNEWYAMYQEINEKYRSEILRSLDIDHRKAYLQKFPEKAK